MLRALEVKCHDTADRAVAWTGSRHCLRGEVCRPGYVNLHDRVRAGSVAVDADEVVDIASVERRIQKTRQVEDVTIGPRSCVAVDGILIGGTDLLEDHSIDAGPTRQRIVARTANEHIVARTTTDDVVAGIAEQDVSNSITSQRIIEIRTNDVGIGRSTRCDGTPAIVSEKS